MRCEGNLLVVEEVERPAIVDAWHFAAGSGCGTVLAGLCRKFFWYRLKPIYGSVL
jgi:hypothetical protein